MSKLTNKRILVTGGCGFIGSHLVRRLVQEKAKVFVFDRKDSPRWRLADVAAKVTFYGGDVSNREAVFACLKKVKPQIIYNLAALRQTGREVRLLKPSVETNVLGLFHLVEAVQTFKLKLQAFVQTGSMEEYGNIAVPYKEQQREQPVSPYTASKVSATHYCQMLYRSLSFPVVVIRPALAYGPAQSADMFIPSLITCCLANKPFPMSSGEQTRDLIYVTDLVEAFVLAGQKNKALGEVINVGTMKEHQIKKLAQIIVKLSGGKTMLEFGKLQRVGEVKRLVGNNTKARRLLGWSPRTDLKAGLRQTIAWYRSQL